jgi:hypothetical protein
MERRKELDGTGHAATFHATTQGPAPDRDPTSFHPAPLDIFIRILIPIPILILVILA